MAEAETPKVEKGPIQFSPQSLRLVAVAAALEQSAQVMVAQVVVEAEKVEALEQAPQVRATTADHQAHSTPIHQVEVAVLVRWVATARRPATATEVKAV